MTQCSLAAAALLTEQDGCSAAEGFEIDVMLRKEFDDAGSEIVLAAMPFNGWSQFHNQDLSPRGA